MQGSANPDVRMVRNVQGPYSSKKKEGTFVKESLVSRPFVMPGPGHAPRHEGPLSGAWVVHFWHVDQCVPEFLLRWCRPVTTADQLHALGAVRFVIPNVDRPAPEAKGILACIGLMPEMTLVSSPKGNTTRTEYYVTWYYRCTVCGALRDVSEASTKGRKDPFASEQGCLEGLQRLQTTSAGNHASDKRHKSELLKHTIPLTSLLGVLTDGKSARYAATYLGRNLFGYTADGCWYTSCSEQGRPLPTKQTARECLGFGELLLPATWELLKTNSVRVADANGKWHQIGARDVVGLELGCAYYHYRHAGQSDYTPTTCR
jgi:hypothetical protein